MMEIIKLIEHFGWSLEKLSYKIETIWFSVGFIEEWESLWCTEDLVINF